MSFCKKFSTLACQTSVENVVNLGITRVLAPPTCSGPRRGRCNPIPHEERAQGGLRSKLCSLDLRQDNQNKATRKLLYWSSEEKWRIPERWSIWTSRSFPVPYTHIQPEQHRFREPGSGLQAKESRRKWIEGSGDVRHPWPRDWLQGQGRPGKRVILFRSPIAGRSIKENKRGKLKPLRQSRGGEKRGKRH
jgi:hypothetical protein